MLGPLHKGKGPGSPAPRLSHRGRSNQPLTPCTADTRGLPLLKHAWAFLAVVPSRTCLCLLRQGSQGPPLPPQRMCTSFFVTTTQVGSDPFLIPAARAGRAQGLWLPTPSRRLDRGFASVSPLQCLGRRKRLDPVEIGTYLLPEKNRVRGLTSPDTEMPPPSPATQRPALCLSLWLPPTHAEQKSRLGKAGVTEILFSAWSFYQGSDLDLRRQRSAQVPSPEWPMQRTVYAASGCASHHTQGQLQRSLGLPLGAAILEWLRAVLEVSVSSPSTSAESG